jgi:catechol 2,3-dioxygenase-like lactoylglutathione lyase family enzyme
MLTGLNHLTLAVRDLPRSIAFYRDLLHFHLDAKWDTGAYLHLGDLWLCLTLDTGHGAAHRGRARLHPLRVFHRAGRFFSVLFEFARSRRGRVAGRSQRRRFVLFS